MGEEQDVYVDLYYDEVAAMLVPRTITLPQGKWEEIQDLLYGYGNDEIRHSEKQPDERRAVRLRRMGQRIHALADLLEPPEPAEPTAAPEEDG